MKFQASWWDRSGGTESREQGLLVGPVVHDHQLFLVVLPQYHKEPIMLPAVEVELTPCD